MSVIFIDAWVAYSIYDLRETGRRRQGQTEGEREKERRGEGERDKQRGRKKEGERYGEKICGKRQTERKKKEIESQTD